MTLARSERSLLPGYLVEPAGAAGHRGSSADGTSPALHLPNPPHCQTSPREGYVQSPEQGWAGGAPLRRMMHRTEDLIAGVIRIPTGISEGAGKSIPLSQPHSSWVITFDLLKPTQTRGHCVGFPCPHAAHCPCVLLDGAKPQPEAVAAFWW